MKRTIKLTATNKDGEAVELTAKLNIDSRLYGNAVKAAEDKTRKMHNSMVDTLRGQGFDYKDIKEK